MDFSIVNVKVQKYDNPKSITYGFFDVKFGNDFMIRGFKLIKIKSNNSYLASSPSKKLKDNTFFDIIRFNKESAVRENILQKALEAFAVGGLGNNTQPSPQPSVSDAANDIPWN